MLVPASNLVREFETGEDVLVGWDAAAANVLGPEEQDEQLTSSNTDAAG